MQFITPGVELPLPQLRERRWSHRENDGAGAAGVQPTQQHGPKLIYKGRTLAFMADLLPSAGHIPLPYVMGYDMRPLVTYRNERIFCPFRKVGTCSL